MHIDAHLEQLTWRIIKCAMKVHSALGPGLLESSYLACLVAELLEAGFECETGVKLPLSYKGVTLEQGYVIDIVVDGLVVLELKAVEQVLPVHEAQLVTYLKLSGKPVGLLLNFNAAHMKDGIRRKVNTKRADRKIDK